MVSIWCSGPLIGHDPYGVDVVDDNSGQGGVPVQVRSYANGWSNHFPTTDGSVERDACIDVAFIPAWCVGGADDDYESVGPWLRLGVHSWQHNWVRPAEVVGKVDAGVVLDEAAVRALVEQLNEWLARPKVAPADHLPAGQPEAASDTPIGGTVSASDAQRLRAERWAATHPDDTFVDRGDGDWKLVADDGHILDWGPR